MCVGACLSPRIPNPLASALHGCIWLSYGCPPPPPPMYSFMGWQVVRYLSTLPEVDVSQPTANGATPFFVACQNGHLPVVEFLSGQAGIDVTTPLGNGGTPFYVACQNGHIGVVRFLLGDERIDIAGGGPLYIACEKGHTAVRCFCRRAVRAPQAGCCS